MKGTRAFPRATNILRSVMIAGAGTAIWMALSATAASADTGAGDNHPLLGEVTAPTISIPVPNVPLPAPVKAIVPTKPITLHVPAVKPIVEHIGGSVDTIVGTVPVVNHVVPAEAVENVVDVVATPVTGSVDETVEAVIPPVTYAVPPVVPGLPPLAGGGSEPPATPPGDTAPGVGTLPGTGIVSSPQGEADAGTALQEPAPAQVEHPALAITASANAPVLSTNRVLGAPGTVPAVGATPTQDPTAPTELPADPKAVPAALAGVGSGNSQNGPPNPAAAFLHGGLIIPADSLTDLVTVSDEHHPKPVCFDPGSSPD